MKVTRIVPAAAGQLAAAVSAVSRVSRGAIVQAWMRRQAPLRRRPAEDDVSFLIWPPVGSRRDFADIQARLQWLFPWPGPAAPTVRMAVHRAFNDTRLADTDTLVATPQPKVRVEPAAGSRAWHSALAESHLLIWKFFDRRTLAVLRGDRPAWIIDPRCYSSLEVAEWLLMFMRHAPAELKTTLENESAINLRRMLQTRGPVACANVCGTGPMIERIYGEAVSDAFNVVCNTAVQSDRLMSHVRPAAIAYLNPPYFGPSRNAHDVMRAVARCVERYGSYVFVPEGFAHYLLAVNYPDIRAHVIGLRPSPDWIAPTPDLPAAKDGKNVLTSLMIPAALAVRPARLRIWGCDGFADNQARRSHWSYAGDMRPDPRTLAAAHPAMMADYQPSMKNRLAMFTTHCATVAEFLPAIERMGIEVVCSSPSTIPALGAREERPAVAAAGRSGA